LKENSDERRRHTRYRYKTNVWLEDSPRAEMVRLRSLNLSAGGLLIEIDKEKPVGSTCLLRIELPFFVDPITAACCVIHSTKLPDGGYATGIELTAVEGITEEQLLQFLGELFG